jgi:hypothetical protein
MTHAEKLRRRAELLRRAAGHPTEGGTNIDCILLAMAERLEREIDVAPAPTIIDDAGDDGPKGQDGEVNPMTETRESDGCGSPTTDPRSPGTDTTPSCSTSTG